MRSASGQTASGFPNGPTWRVALGAAPVGSPVLDGGRLFVALRSGRILARALIDGRELWAASLLAVRPIAAEGGIVAVPLTEGIRGLAATSGQAVWDIRGLELSAPMLLAGGWLIAASGEQMLAFRAADGTVVWSRTIGRAEQRPAVEGNTLFASMQDGRLVALELETGSLRWERKIGDALTEPFAYDGRVYVGASGREFVCVRSDNGDEAWRSQIGAAVRGPAVADPVHVYVVSLDNLVRALHRTNGAVQWKQDLRYRPTAGPLLVGGHVTAGGMSPVLRGFAARTGSAAGELKLGDDAVAAPVSALAAGSRPILVTVTGNLRNEWSLVAAAEPAPSISVAPLTALPGEARPLISPPSGGSPL